MSRGLEALAQVLPVGERSSAFTALVDELPFGVIWLGSDGEVHYRNPAADRILSGAQLERVSDELARLRVVCADSGGCVSTSVDARAERITIHLAPGPAGDGFVGVLRSEVLPVVVEVRALYTMLKSMAAEPDEAVVARQALGLVQESGVRVAYFRHDPAHRLLRCEVAQGFGEADPSGQAVADKGDDLISQAFAQGRAMPPKGAAGDEPPMRLSGGPYSAAFAVPVWNDGKVVGVVAAVQATGRPAPVVKRLLESVAAALAALAHQRALKKEAAWARDVAAQRDRLATIGQLVAGVAHEINNPLAFLKSNLHSLKSEVEALGPSGARALSEVEAIVAESLEGVARIEAVVMALRNTARQRTEKARFDPARAVAEAVTIFRGAKKGELEIELTLPTLPDAVGSPSHLGQVALNLMQNGLDAMGGRGRIKVQGFADRDGARIAFSDTGTGIPEEVQKKMFDAFYTTKELGKGTGLGLYLCKEILAGMGGRLGYRTGPTGTTFEVWLPAAPE